jgi:hypothetical protein
MAKGLKTVIPELDNAAIRRTPDGKCSVYDLIAVVGGQKNPRDTWKVLKESFPEVVGFSDNFQFPGRGQRKTPVTDREGWAYILGLLPGVMGHKYRESAAKLVIRYLDADVTLAEDIVERTQDEPGLERLEARVRGKRIRNEHTRMLMSRGVRTGREFAICTNKTYIGLYGKSAKGLREQKGLGKKSNVRESMTTNELIEVGFSENLSTRKIGKSPARGHVECGHINYKTARSVAEFIRDELSA